MAAVGPSRQDTWVLRVYLDNVYMGIWDKKTGGEFDSDEAKYYPGNMAPAISLGGKRTTGNITLQRFYGRQRDHDNIQKWFNAVGRGIVTVSQKPKDFDGIEYGKPIIYNGTLKRCSPPDVDSEGTGVALFEIEVTVDGDPSS